MKSWQLQDAKAHFSEMIKDAVTDGPQEITLRGKPTAVVISKTDFDRLAKPKPSFIEFMRQSPLVGIKISVNRDRSKTRDIDI